jgi:hypothetical protein
VRIASSPYPTNCTFRPRVSTARLSAANSRAAWELGSSLASLAYGTVDERINFGIWRTIVYWNKTWTLADKITQRTFRRCCLSYRRRWFSEHPRIDAGATAPCTLSRVWHVLGGTVCWKSQEKRPASYTVLLRAVNASDEYEVVTVVHHSVHTSYSTLQDEYDTEWKQVIASGCRVVDWWRSVVNNSRTSFCKEYQNPSVIPARCTFHISIWKDTQKLGKIAFPSSCLTDGKYNTSVYVRYSRFVQTCRLREFTFTFAVQLLFSFCTRTSQDVLVQNIF